MKTFGSATIELKTSLECVQDRMGEEKLETL